MFSLFFLLIGVMSHFSGPQEASLAALREVGLSEEVLHTELAGEPQRTTGLRWLRRGFSVVSKLATVRD